MPVFGRFEDASPPPGKAPGMAAGRREENYFSAPQGQNPPQNRQNPRNRNENPHRQSRPAASRIAGASNRSRQPTGDSRPSSLGERSRKGKPLPGFRRWRRKESESFFPATRAAGKILLTERRVGAALAGPAPKRSAIATGGTPGLTRGNGGAISTKHYTERSVAARPPLGGLAAAPERSDWPSSQRPGGAETGPSRWRKSPWRF